MLKFRVTVIKEVWERAEIEVEAVDETAAASAAIAQAQTDEEIAWRWEETHSYDAIAVEEADQPAAPLSTVVEHKDTLSDRMDDLRWEVTECTAALDECKRELDRYPNEGAETQRMITHLETKRVKAREKLDALELDDRDLSR